LHQKDAPDLVRQHAKAHQHSDVPGLLHHHHGQGDQNIQRRHQYDQSDDDEGDDFLQRQRSKQLSVHFDPVGRLEARSGGLFDLFPNRRRLIHVVHLEADDRNYIRLSEELLRIGKSHKRHSRVVLIKAGVIDSRHAKLLEAGNDPYRS